MPATGSSLPVNRRSVLRTAGALAAAGSLAAATAGCGSNTGRSSGGNQLVQQYHQYGEKGTQQAAQKFAKAYKDADVKVVWTPGDYPNKIASSLQSSNAPDIFEWQFTIDMVKSGQIAPLDDILADVKSDFTPEDLRINTYQGKVYGIRMIDDPQVLYYRKSLLAAAGVKPPTTWDELIDAAKKVNTPKVKGIYFGSQNITMDHNVLFATAGGAPLITPDNKSNVLSDQVIAAYLKVKELYTSGALLQSAPTEWTDPSAFNQGLVAMQWCGLWALPEIQKRFGDDFGVVPMPKIGPSGKPLVYNGGWTQFVNAKGKNIEAAKKYVKWLWLTQTQYQEEWALEYGFHIPPRKSVAAKASKLRGGQAAEVLKLAQQYGVGDNPAYSPKMRSAVSDALSKIIRNGTPPKVALAPANTVVETELKRQLG